MSGADQELGPLQKAVFALVLLLLAAALMIGAEAVWSGTAVEVIQRIWRSLFERWDGRLSFRFILQPVMAAIPAIHDGIKDARAGRSPYFWTVAASRRERGGRLREGLIATARIILLGLVMDVIYQALEFRTFYPGEALIVALLLCFVPYLLIRGPVNRIVRRWRGRVAAGEVR